MIGRIHNFKMNLSLRHSYLDAMGIQSWSLKSTLDESLSELKISQEQIPQEQIPQKEMAQFIEKDQQETTINKHSELSQVIRLCKKCPSREHRLNALIGQGSHNAKVFVITGAPTAEEDRVGHYLSGSSESLFHAMLCSVGLDNTVYVSGLLKCYSMTDFIVNKQELEYCLSYLQTQIEHINPSILFILGAFEAQSILKTKQSFNELRSKIHTIRINKKEYSAIVSYHPDYLLRNPLYKKQSLNDLIMLKGMLE